MSLRQLTAASVSLLVGLLLVGCSWPGSGVVDDVGLAGVYTVNGFDTVGTEYSGTVVIEPGDEDGLWNMSWIVTGAIHEGVGRQTGDRLEVTWSAVTSPRGDVSGTASYEISPNGDLIGTRSIDGVDGVGTEEIFQEA